MIALLAMAASAQQVREPIDLERFKPAITHDPFVVTEGTSVRWPPGEDPGQLGLALNLAFNPLVTVEDGEIVDRFVARRVGIDLFGSFTIVERLAFAVGIPAFVGQVGDANPTPAGLGDVRLLGKWQIRDARRGLGIALIPELRLPSHTDEEFSGGARSPVFAPRLALDHRFGFGLRLGTNVGLLLRETTRFLNVEAGPELTYSAAASFHPGGYDRPVAVGVDVHGGAGFAGINREEIPLEGQLYLQIEPTNEWMIQAGPSFGLLPGFGTPTSRLMATLRWSPTRHDRDGDGISDKRDKCPDRAETINGREDRDGCPDDDAPLGMVRVTVLDAETGEPIEKSRARVDRVRAEPGAREGRHEVEVEPGRHTLWVRARGYVPQKIEIKVGPGRTLNKTVRLQPSRIRVTDDRLEFDGKVYFEFDSAALVPESHDLLDDIADAMKDNPQLKLVRVEGHTDKTGPAAYNQQLSEDRARSVRNYLVRAGVASERLDSRGYGEDRPISNRNFENRRVEFVIVEANTNRLRRY